MGRVLLGAGPDGRLVAVKLVHARLVDLPGFRERFRHEVAANSAVSGAYTAAVIDADADAPTPWLASVYVPAPSLRDAAPLPEAAVLRLAAGLAGALVEIHGAGLVHADLKPSNVLLTDDGLRVIDFGVARAAEEGAGEASGEQVHDGPLVGTPGFMSPEQAEGRLPTPASDVFALGSVLAMACTGRGPFDGPGTPQTLYNVVHTEPDLSALPDAVRPIVAACLAKEPDERPAPGRLLEMIGRIAPAARPWPVSVQRLIEQRRAEAARLLSEETAHTRVDPTFVERSRRADRRLAVGGVGAVCVVLAAAILVWSPWSGSAARTGGSPSPSKAAKPPVSYPLRGHTDFVQEVAFSPDGKTLVTASNDHTVRLWDVVSRTQRGKPLQHPDGVNAAVVTPDGSALFTADDKGYLRVWPMSGRGRSTGFEAGFGPLTTLALSPRGGIMATGDSGQYVRLWSLDKGKAGPAIETQSGNIESLAFSPDGHLLAVGTTGLKRNLDTANTEGVVELWDITEGRKIADLTGYKGWIESVAFSPDGRTLAAAGDEITRFWDVAGRRESSRPITCDGRCYSVAFSPDGRMLATGGSGAVAQLWNLADHRQIGPALAGHTGVIFSVRFSPDGRTLATGSADGTARLWPVPTA
jgi:WD40 repeat protein